MQLDKIAPHSGLDSRKLETTHPIFSYSPTFLNTPDITAISVESPNTKHHSWLILSLHFTSCQFIGPSFNSLGYLPIYNLTVVISDFGSRDPRYLTLTGFPIIYAFRLFTVLLIYIRVRWTWSLVVFSKQKALSQFSNHGSNPLSRLWLWLCSRNRCGVRVVDGIYHKSIIEISRPGAKLRAVLHGVQKR